MRTWSGTRPWRKMVCRLLEIYGKAGLVMNSDKFQFRLDVVEFAGM